MWYAFNFDFGLHDEMFLLMKDMVVFAFLVVLSMCLVQERSEEIVTPRYFDELVEERVWLWIVYWWLIMFRLVVMWMTSHFSGWKDICHSRSQS